MLDSLRYARRLKEAGVPEPQAETQAELMAEAFAFYIDNLVTKDHLDVRMNELETRMSERFAEIDKQFMQLELTITDRFEARFSQLERVNGLHSWMLSLMVVATVIPLIERLLAMT